MRVLVTGAAGFIGSHLLACLLAAGRSIPRQSDGTSERDYTYVDDVVEGIVVGLGWLQRNPGAFEIVNLGNSETVELNRLIRLLGDTMGIEPEIEQLPEQRGDVRRTWADVSKAGRLWTGGPRPASGRAWSGSWGCFGGRQC